jgi:hypothetical protein
MKATTVGDVEKKYKITLDAPKEMLLKTFLQNLGYKSLVESVSGMSNTFNFENNENNEKIAKAKVDTEMLLNQITDYGLQISAIKNHLGIELRREHGYSVIKYSDMVLRKPRKWYQFWK